MEKFPVKSVLKTGIVLVLAIMIFIVLCVLRFLLINPSIHVTLYTFFYVLGAFIFAYVMSSLLNTRRLAFILFLSGASLSATILIALWANTEPVSDFAHLYHLADSLKNGDFETLKGDPYFMRWAYQSGFVIYEAAVMSIFPYGITPLLIMNTFFMTGTVMLVYFISHEIFQERTARLIAVLYLLYPAPYFLASVLTNQHISLFFILAGILVFARKSDVKGGVISGILIALGNALRPDASIVIASFCVMIVMITFFVWRKGFIMTIKSTMPFLTIIISSALTGMMIAALVMMSGVNPNGQKNSDPLWKFVTGMNVETIGRYSNELANRVFSVKDDDERHAVEREIIREHLSAEPQKLSAFFLDKNIMMWASFEATSWAFAGQNERHVPIVSKPLEQVLQILKPTERLYFLGISLVACLSLLVLFQKKEAHFLLVLCGLTILLFFVIYTFIEIQPRYRYFLMPFIFILAGAGFEWRLNGRADSRAKAILYRLTPSICKRRQS